MAARKKVKASARNKKRQASNMPPEMRAAMMGGSAASPTPGGTAVRNRILPKILNSAATDSALDSEYFDAIEERLFWKPETPRQRSAYIVDLGQQKLTVACVKAVFLRALDENGERVFTTEEDFNAMMERGNCEIFEEIGAYMLGIANDDDDEAPEKPAETTVNSEKEE